MEAIVIKDKYFEILSKFVDDLQSAVDLALQRYTIELITAKIAELQEKDAGFQTKYGCNYLSFTQRIAEDEDFVAQIENTVSKLWEIDLAEWEFCYKGIEDWTQKLQNILMIS